MASLSTSFSILALSRSSNNKPYRKNPNSKIISKPKSKSNSKSKSSDEKLSATTYTRLPPKDDLLASSLIEAYREIKLSDSSVVLKQLNGSNYEDYEVRDVKEYEDFDEDEIDYEEDDDDGETMVFRGEEFEDEKDKEKGVPAVMRCFDRAKIFVKAGNGGNGVMAFRREKFVPLGGPSGGDGGRGGNVYVEVDGAMNSLLPFRNCLHFRAGRGGHGHGKNQHGPRGEDVVVKVAPGTVIREVRDDGIEGQVLLELLHPGQRALLLPGGRGGRGNAAFKSGVNKVPKIAENGEEGSEMGRFINHHASLRFGTRPVYRLFTSAYLDKKNHRCFHKKKCIISERSWRRWLELELKLVADVGIVGAPNAGKSTLLSVISAARPEIANYPFTTLLPNLGVVSFDYDSTMVVADLPGLLEGAHRGFGLGHEFLRHTERCSVLVHVVDGSSPQPESEFDAIRLELELFNPELAEKPYIVAFNKMDLPEASEKWETFKEYLLGAGIQPFSMSAISKQGTQEVICASYELVRKVREAAKEVEGRAAPVNLNHVAESIKKKRAVPINEFEITHDSSSRTWHVVGDGLQRFVQMTNWQYVDSERRFQHVLDACGVNKSLIDSGVKEGDTVIIAGLERVWYNSSGSIGNSSARKASTNSIRWPDWK